MKYKKHFLIGLIAMFLVAGLIAGSNLNTSAVQNKILVTDSDDSGTISAGDEFCIGSECFNVVNNEVDVAQYASNINSFDVVNRYAPGTTNPRASDINPIYYISVAATVGAVIFVTVRKGRR